MFTPESSSSGRKASSVGCDGVSPVSCSQVPRRVWTRIAIALILDGCFLLFRSWTALPIQEEARRKRIGYKPEVFGPPGLAPPIKNILRSDGKEKYFRFGGGLSVRGAVELVRTEEAQARTDRENERKALFGIVDTVELDFRVGEARQKIAEERLAEKIARRQEDAVKKRAARLALLEARMKALLREDEEEHAPPDKIGKLDL